MEATRLHAGDSLQLGEGGWGENGVEDSSQFGDAGQKHLAQPLSIYPHGFQKHFMIRAGSRNRLRPGYSAPGWKSRIQCGEHGGDCLSECWNQVGGAALDVFSLSQERLADTVLSGDGGQR